MRYCLWCVRQFVPNRIGRKRLYCSSACRNKSYQDDAGPDRLRYLKRRNWLGHLRRSRARQRIRSARYRARHPDESRKYIREYMRDYRAQARQGHRAIPQHAAKGESE